MLGVTPPRERALDEVKDQVEARWRDDQVASRLQTKATEMVQKLSQGGSLADEATAAGVKVETSTGFKREDSPPGVPSGAIAAAFRTAKDGYGQTPGPNNEWIVFRVTDVTVPPVDLASDDMKKLKDQLSARHERRAGRAICRKARKGYRHDRQRGRLRASDRGEQQLSVC